MRLYYFVFVHSSWQRAPNTLGISHGESNKGVTCYVNEVTLEKH